MHIFLGKQVQHATELQISNLQYPEVKSDAAELMSTGCVYPLMVLITEDW